MFQGSKHRAGNEQDFAGLLEANGASDLNASTWNDRTNYYETLPSNRLELALWLESERMAFLLDGLDQGKLDTQRDVVRNERRQTVENTPYGKAEVRLLELLVPQAPPLPRRGHRLARGPPGGDPRRREGLLPDLLRAQQRLAGGRRRLRSRRRPGRWWRSTSARSPAARRCRR